MPPSGLRHLRETGLVINVDTALRVDAVLQVGAEIQTVTVEATAAHVDTQTQQTGEVIGGTEMANLPLNAVPEGLENGIGKPERQKVLHGFLAQVVVVAIDL